MATPAERVEAAKRLEKLEQGMLDVLAKTLAAGEITKEQYDAAVEKVYAFRRHLSPRSCCAVPPRILPSEAHDFTLKSTEALNDIANRIPSLFKEIVDSGSAVISEIKMPGCHSYTFEQFQKTVVRSDELAKELERERLAAYSRFRADLPGGA